MRPLLILVFASAAVFAQQPKPAEFDVVSIKPNTSGERGNAMRTLPDGTQVMTNTTIRRFILAASPVPAREVLGLPDWADSARYDVTLKPPAGATNDQHREMMRTMFAARMKLVAHIEQHERLVYSLVLARSDGRLGPELKKSTLNCGPRPPGTPPEPPPPPRSGPPDPKEFATRCGMMFGATTIVTGGMPMNVFVNSLAGLAGGEVENQTGLEGFYAFTLKFSRQRGPGAPLDQSPNAVPAAVDDLPDIFTALQEQLGLKLVPGKKMMPVFIIDHIERPSEN